MIQQFDVKKIAIDYSDVTDEETSERRRLEAGKTLSIMIAYPTNKEYPGLYMSGTIGPDKAMKALKYAKRYSVSRNAE